MWVAVQERGVEYCFVAHVYSYVQHILSAGEFSTPSMSPTKVGEELESEIRKFEVKRKCIQWRRGKFEEVDDEDAKDLSMG